MNGRKYVMTYFDALNHPDIACLTDENFGKLMRLYLKYVDDFIESEIPSHLFRAFVRLQVDADRHEQRRIEKSEKARASVSVRWGKDLAASDDTNDTDVSENTNDTDVSENTEDTNGDIYNSICNSINISEDGMCAKKRTPSKRFTPPTVEDVRLYCAERKNGVDPQRFIDHYEAVGWKVGGRAAMKDWRAAVRTWERNWQGDSTLSAQSVKSVSPVADVGNLADLYSR